jgi:hypothetical protein
MEIKGKVHCFFEQSGTFKNEFIKLGIPAEDYDIQNNFGETDHVVDLFKAIEDAYDGKPSLFDQVGGEDLILAFFPCIYFCDASTNLFRYSNKNYSKLTIREKTDKILKRGADRQYFLSLLTKMVCICMENGIRMIIENPYNGETFLKTNFVLPPTIVDKDRSLRGDFFRKPTAYWFIGCNNTYGFTEQKNKEVKTICGTKGSGVAGLCGEDRSMLSPDYARNFICDFIIGKEQIGTQLSMFDMT